MKPKQRQEQMLAQLHALQSELTVEELAKKFAVSSLTIRRDLDQLEAECGFRGKVGGIPKLIRSVFRN